MGSRKVVLLLLLLIAFWAATAVARHHEDRGRRRREEEEEGEEEEEYGGKGWREEGKGLFILEKSKKVLQAEGGEIRVVKGFKYRGRTGSPMHIGFVSMEPNTLFIPQYMDVSLILFVRKGGVKIGWIHKDRLEEKQLKMGDIYIIPAGSTFYMVNTDKGQRLQIICGIDTSESLRMGPFQSFFIAGGSNPRPLLAGFDRKTLTTAFNVTESELRMIMGRQTRGAIVYLRDTEPGEQPHKLSSILRRLDVSVSRRAQVVDDDEDEAQEAKSWTWRDLLSSFIGNRKSGAVQAPDAYNLYDRKPDFQNDYGSSMAIDEHDYAPLKKSDIGVYLVNLSAGSMMAPHINPRATEYGVVLRGSGTIQVVFPNGTNAMNAQVEEGDVFWIPRYFPFCQIASRSGPFEFFGYSTSSKPNHPQFLIGASSILRTMHGPELAAALDLSEERLGELLDAQGESTILPQWPIPSFEVGRKKKVGESLPLLIKRMS